MKQLLIVLGFCLLILAFTLVWYAGNLKANEHQPDSSLEDGGTRISGDLTYSVRTISYNGQYAPRNIGVIWITNLAGTFIKTIKIWGGTSERAALSHWNAASGGNTVGAITGATLLTHTTHTVTWNMLNYSSAEVPDGTYRVWTEFSEGDGTNRYVFTEFNKNNLPQHLTPVSTAYFSNIVLDYTPFLPPSALSINRVGNTAVLDWVAVPHATSYRVYSASDPYQQTAWTLETPLGVTNTTHTVSLTAPRRFYRVTALK